jgi:hypothetical protein
MKKSPGLEYVYMFKQESVLWKLYGNYSSYKT